jgi:hypothetical protein
MTGNAAWHKNLGLPAWVREGQGWLADNLAPTLAASRTQLAERIEARAAETAASAPGRY